jgi:ribosome biogenesis protein Nip4
VQAQETRRLKLKEITEFASRFGTSLRLNESLIAATQGRYFLLNSNVRKLLSRDFFYAGIYLGKVKDGLFFPSFVLLAKIASAEGTNKVVVDPRSEWLFIVGRDIFRQGITKVIGSNRKGAYAMVVNQYDECLGFGRILHDLGDKEGKHRVAVRNVSDIGDFLRRERRYE